MLGVSGCVHDGWLYLTKFRDVDEHFLYYFFHWKKQHFYNSAYGAAIQNINTEILRNTDIALPPLPVQERIASILSAYDDLIANNTRRHRLGRRDVVPGSPIRFVRPRVEVLLDKLFPARQSVASAHQEIIDRPLHNHGLGWTSTCENSLNEKLGREGLE